MREIRYGYSFLIKIDFSSLIYSLISQMYLPSDLFPLVMSFIERPDWRTCRKHEADCIAHFNDWTNQVFDDELDWYYPVVREKPRLDPETYLTWTLFGRWYLHLLTRTNIYWQDSCRFPTRSFSKAWDECETALYDQWINL
jgi:hypothetical protein